MSNRPGLTIWIYGIVFVALAVAGCWTARKHILHPTPSIGIASPQGKTLTSVLSYQWSARGLRHLPHFSGGFAYQTILIDPGHGGKDPGAQGIDGVIEKNIVLDISLRLQKLLQANGIRVFMTRSDDRFFSLEERTEMIKKYQPDLFLSIHANSSSDANVSGIEVYYAEEEAYWANVHKALNDAVKNSEEMAADVPAELYEYEDWKKKFREESAALARHVSSGLTETLGTRNRGVKHKHFYVLSESVAPALLLEIGFVTHADEGRKLNTEQYRQTFAETLAKSLLDYVKTQ